MHSAGFAGALATGQYGKVSDKACGIGNFAGLARKEGAFGPCGAIEATAGGDGPFEGKSSRVVKECQEKGS